MIDFQFITKQERLLYEQYLFSKWERGCELSFANLNMWGEQKIAIVHEQLVIFTKYEGTYTYHFPLGEGDKKAALEAIFADAKERGIPCKFSRLYPEQAELLESLYPEQFYIQYDPGSFDYIYDIEKLAELKGRKYHRKRNHYSRFCKNNPNFYTEPVSEQNLSEVRAFLAEWYQAKIAESPENDYHSEQAALEKCFSNYNALGLESLVLFRPTDTARKANAQTSTPSREILAFTIASRISPTTFDVHFEKARWDVEGAYPAINCEFAKYIKQHYPEVTFLNREEDLGLEGLRKAKQSYFPHHMLKKADAIRYTDLPFVITEPTSAQLPALRTLWKETFGDSESFLDTFFETAFAPYRCRCIFMEETLVSALYWFDCEYHEQRISYIYGVATAKEFRRQGFCHILMHDTHHQLTKNGYIGALLSPSDASLVPFYETIGYTPATSIKELYYSNLEDTLQTMEITPVSIYPLDKATFSNLRRQYLSKSAVLQENENLDFLETQAKFYAGEQFLLTASQTDAHLHGLEFLGDPSLIPAILQHFNCTSGIFRTYGTEHLFTMYYPFTEDKTIPDYFGFSFD